MPRSLVRQSIHYLSRPHEGVPDGPLGGPAAWRGADVRDSGAWIEELTQGQVDELRRAVDHARSTGKATRDLVARDLPLPTLSRRIASFRRELDDGRGFVLLRGVPVTDWSPEDAERFFWGFGLHLGVPGAQNPEGHLLGHVRDQGLDYESGVRAYRTRTHINYHCDMADVVGLLCVKAAREGGRSRIASSVTIHDELMRRDRALAGRLYRPYLLDTRSEGGLRFFPVTPCRHAEGRVRTFYHTDYFRSSNRHTDAPPIEARAFEALDAFDAIGMEDDVRLEMDLRPGDVQLLSNHSIVHGRTSYEDHEDPADKRHLLRLWVSLHLPRSLRHRALTAASRAALLATLARERIRQR